jgi:hypothetical protein
MEPDIDPCVLCDGPGAQTLPADFDGIHQRCKNCGEFRIAGSALSGLGSRKTLLPRLRGWIYDQNNAREVPLVTTDRVKLLGQMPLPTLVERANRLLAHVAKKLAKLGDVFLLKDPSYLPVTYSADPGEVLFLMRFLEEKGWISGRAVGAAEVTAEGYTHLDSLTRKGAASTQGFVAMWFDESLRGAYEQGLEPAVRHAGYQPLRVDSVEHSGRIDDEIIRQIRASRFVVADFTGHRGGVYFEAGFAMGLGMPVIWACRGDCIKDLHFDIRQYNCVEWKEPADLAIKLQRRIEAVLGRGPHVR